MLNKTAMPNLIVYGVIIWTLSLTGCQQQDPISRFVKKPLPPNAKLLHSASQMFGPDESSIFEFEVDDKQLLDLLINEWSLQAVDEPSTSFSKDGPEWWPEQQQLDAMKLKYEFFDPGSKQYRSVWTDDTGNRLYAEAGDW